VRYLDFMDAYLRPDEVNHPCDNIMAVLAAAEDIGASGQDFVTAVCISFEIQNHLLDLPTMRAGVNYTTPLAFSVAAGVSKILGLDTQHTANALAIAGVGAVSCAVIQAEPVSNWKGLASGESQARSVSSKAHTVYSNWCETVSISIGRRSGSALRNGRPSRNTMQSFNPKVR
jgi:2-methylcitrate dehydratase